MKKTFFKILGTILAVVIFFIAQYHIRQYYVIDPRIWFFVVYCISFVGFVAILAAFRTESESIREYFKTHSFSEFISEISRKVKPIAAKVKNIAVKAKPITAKAKTITAKVKPITAKIVNSFIYELLSFIILTTSFTGIMYKLFFHDDFMTRTTIYIVFLVMIACTALSRIVKVTVIEREKRKKELVYGGMWVFIFLIHFTEFVCI